MTDVRKGQAPATLDRAAFGRRWRQQFFDPAFDAEHEALARLEEIAWQAYDEGRKSPRTRKAGAGYADPDYELSVEWIEARERIERAQAAWRDPASPARVLLVCGAARNDGTCPGEMSKTFRLGQLAREGLEERGMQVESAGPVERAIAKLQLADHAVA